MTERIAVVRALQLGDMLVSVPALRALRNRCPAAEVTLIGLPWAASFVERFPMYLDRFVEFRGWPGIVEAPYDEARTGQFLAEQRAYRYDLAVQLHGSGVHMNGFALGLGARRTAGFHPGACPPGLSPAVEYPDDLPEVLRLLRVAEILGADVRDTDLEFPVTEFDRKEVAGLLPPRGLAGGLRVGIHAGASAPSRRWPASRFAQVANQLVSRYGAQVVLTGGPGEEEVAEAVAVQIEAPVTNLAGQTSLGGLAAVISDLDLFVTNDTGPSHIATALGTPSVTIFGPADLRRWAPLNADRHRVVHHPVACSPCPHRVCPIDHRCLQNIQPDDVLAAIETLLTRATVI